MLKELATIKPERFRVRDWSPSDGTVHVMLDVDFGEPYSFFRDLEVQPPIEYWEGVMFLATGLNIQRIDAVDGDLLLGACHAVVEALHDKDEPLPMPSDLGPG